VLIIGVRDDSSHRPADEIRELHKGFLVGLNESGFSTKEF
jgi:hypothetical protein